MSEEEMPEEPAENPDGAADQPAAATSAAEPRQWDGKPTGIPMPRGEARETQRPQVTDAKEERLDNDNSGLRPLRFDLTRARDVAAHDINHYYGFQSQRQARGKVSVAELDREVRVHVTTRSDGKLRQRLGDHRVVFLRGPMRSGRRTSAIVVLDKLTRTAPAVSKVTVLDSGSGLAGLPALLEAGSGHVLDASAETWIDMVTEAQVAAAREALGDRGYLVVLVDADGASSLPSAVVDQQYPDLSQVMVFHLAARLATVGTPDTDGARALISQACQADPATEQWHAEITKAAAGTAEAALFADAIWDWQHRRTSDSAARPQADKFRDRHRDQLAADLLRRGHAADSPLRQSYVISAAVLDGLAVREVIEGAGKLGALLGEVEHPGAPGHREIFGQPLARWLSHVEMTAPPADRRNRDGTLVRMPSRELSRSVIEVAWRNYDAAREPLLAWLMNLCQEHPDERVRIRAVQALAVIAHHDYALIKDRVLEVWSRSGRPIEHQAAAWLLEAMVLEATEAGRVKDVERVKDLLWRWSRSGDVDKRAVAVRAYGTAVATKLPRDPLKPPDAILGVRFSAPDPDLGVLLDRALCEMYILGLTREVMAELVLWTRGFPVMRERSGRALVRISRVRRVGDDGVLDAYDLLWMLAHELAELGMGAAEVAALWHVACRYETTRGAAWQMLGRWAQTCRDDAELRNAFTELADEFEKAADNDESGARLAVYRRRWSEYLDKEERK